MQQSPSRDPQPQPQPQPAADSLLQTSISPRHKLEAWLAEMVRMNASGEIRERLIQASYEPGTMSPEEYGAMIDRELILWGNVVNETGVRVKA